MRKLTHIFTMFFMLALFSAFVPQTLSAQNNDIKAMKVALITTRVDLTEEEAKSFWPVYDSYFKDRKTARQEVKNDESLSLADKRLAVQEKDLAVRKEYHSKFKDILSDERIELLYQAEEEFMKILQEAKAQQKQCP